MELSSLFDVGNGYDDGEISMICLLMSSIVARYLLILNIELGKSFLITFLSSSIAISF